MTDREKVEKQRGCMGKPVKDTRTAWAWLLEYGGLQSRNGLVVIVDRKGRLPRTRFDTKIKGFGIGSPVRVRVTVEQVDVPRG